MKNKIKINQNLENIYELYENKEKLITRYHEIEKEIRDRNDLNFYMSILIGVLSLLKEGNSLVLSFAFLILSLYKFLIFFTLSQELKSVQDKLKFDKKFKNKTIDIIELFIFFIVGSAVVINLITAWR